MKNPIVQILDDCGTKPSEFAREYDFTRQAIDYYVNGVYPTLSDKLLDSLYDLAIDNGIEWPDIEALYSQWRSAERANWYERFAQRPRPVWDRTTSPFDTFIRDTSGNRSRFAKDLKVPVRDVTRYARGEAVAMPMELQTAFDEIQFPWKAELIAMQYNWRTEYT
jgi:hypothetical protein